MEIWVFGKLDDFPAPTLLLFVSKQSIVPVFLTLWLPSSLPINSFAFKLLLYNGILFTIVILSKLYIVLWDRENGVPDVLFNRLCQHQQCVFLEFLGTLCYVSTNIVLKVYYTHYTYAYSVRMVFTVFTQPWKTYLENPVCKKITQLLLR